MNRIVVIGASSGIGKKIATDFANAGWQVAIASRREDKLKELADKYPEKMVYRPIDITADNAAELFYNLIHENGGMDVLLLASGVGFANPDLEPGKDNSILEVNVKGFTRIINAAYVYFKNTANVHKGRIAAITSIAGTKGLGLAPTYSASKRYQQTYLQAIDQLAHIQEVNVGITDIRPGFIRTDLLDPNKAYPLTMAVDYAAPLIERAILKGKRVATIDLRWNIIDKLWRLIPNCIWPHLQITI
ncbi:MAG: SDR family NAD(P)-dependent oxidoreductase [Muribaculaceae bacterium]|nr:SDR family NAD(P)-dependent oxidoreductase [Muribaculaceae bacterium]